MPGEQKEKVVDLTNFSPSSQSMDGAIRHRLGQFRIHQINGVRIVLNGIIQNFKYVYNCGKKKEN